MHNFKLVAGCYQCGRPVWLPDDAAVMLDRDPVCRYAEFLQQSDHGEAFRNNLFVAIDNYLKDFRCDVRHIAV